jgi:hypothetical protein
MINKGGLTGMLYIKFNDRTAFNDPTMFKYAFEEEWLQDLFVKKMVEDVDKSKVLDNGLIDSPFLGIITPMQLSGGVKMLILAYECDVFIDATCCGDNCAKWFYEISRKKNITINLNYSMHFDCDPEAVLLYEGQEIYVNNEAECNINIVLIINDIIDKDLHPEAREERYCEWRR